MEEGTRRIANSKKKNSSWLKAKSTTSKKIRTKDPKIKKKLEGIYNNNLQNAHK